MKKTLLMLVAFMATMTAFAQDEQEGWEKSFTPVASASDLAGMCTAVAADGAVYASSTYDQVFQFAGKDVKDPEGLLSSCVLKYDKDGNELWSVSLVGACTINAMTADSDGTLYVAGSFMDETLTIAELSATGSLSAYSAFVAKISPTGVVQALKSYTPQVDETIGSLVGDPWGIGIDEPLYQSYFPMEVTPNAIKVDGDKVYISVLFKGDVPSLSWEGRYINSWGLYQDISTRGIFSLNKSDLSAPTSIVNVGADCTDYVLEGDDAYTADALNFVVKEGKVYVAFFGWGNLILNTATESKKFQFEIGQNVSEHALVLSDLSDVQNKTKVFRVTEMKDSPLSAYFSIVNAEVLGDNVFLGGTFFGQLPLDNSKYSPVEKSEDGRSLNASFVASIKMSEGSVNWATPNTVESEATCMIVTGEEIKASTDVATYTLKTATGEVKADKTINYGFADADVYNDEFVSTIRANGASVIVFSPKMEPSGIEAIKAAAVNGETKIYNLNGQRVAAPQKGLYIIDGKKAVIK